MENTATNSNRWGLPTRATVLAYLEDLIAERRSREEVSDWAVQFIREDYEHTPVTDWPAHRMLYTLWGADTPISVSPIKYLFNKPDFEDWLEELRAADENE